MADLSAYLQNQVLKWMRGTTMPAAPTDVYVALWDGNPGEDAASGTEVTTNVRSAGRVAISWGAIQSNSSILNDAVVDFGNSESASTVNVTHAALFDAASGGNMLSYGDLDTSRSIEQGDPVTFPIGDIDFGLA